ncbi:hypothetical protein [Ramlibacter albus]|uniref:DUF4129 domain-containing protein n=1 Tax=Ramlibacter albus TaxID=2079448 RepID=A0A923M4H5_9BURK|nr:hypothetical protein [Ramlibacter albus]MBC5763696.1 hypothetical protein [Ramlibacter albus]
MRVDALALHLRPRPMAEAADLGVLLVHRHAASVWRVWLPVYGVFALLALATVEWRPWLPGLLIFCAKPWLDRTLLYVMARAVFNEPTTLRGLLRDARTVWWHGLLNSLTLRRLSPWRAFTQAVDQLEGQRGRARWRRRNQLLRGKRGAAFGLQAVFAHVELALALGLGALLLWFAPEGTHRHVFAWLWQSDSLASRSVLSIIYAVAVGIVEPFHVAAGFAMYLNRRVELEAWDIEQEFRRAFA